MRVLLRVALASFSDDGSRCTVDPLINARIQKLRRISRIEVYLEFARAEAQNRPPDARLLALLQAAERDLQRLRKETGLEPEPEMRIAASGGRAA